MNDAALLESREIGRAQAGALQNEAIKSNLLLFWVVTTRTSDRGEKFVCRPWCVGLERAGFLSQHLIADDLESLRQQIPPGLSRTDRAPNDDPVIVEVWL